MVRTHAAEVDLAGRRRSVRLPEPTLKRIAQGSGTSVQEINRLLKQYLQMKKMMKGMKGKWLRRAMGGCSAASADRRALQAALL